MMLVGLKTQARKIDKEHQITAPRPVTPRGQTKSGLPVIYPVELDLKPSPGLHQLQPGNEATVISTRIEPASI